MGYDYLFRVSLCTTNFYESYSWVSISLVCVLNIYNVFENLGETLTTI